MDRLRKRRNEREVLVGDEQRWMMNTEGKWMIDLSSVNAGGSIDRFKTNLNGYAVIKGEKEESGK
jgi:hypothetical protein